MEFGISIQNGRCLLLIGKKKNQNYKCTQMKKYYLIGVLLLNQFIVAQENTANMIEYERVYIEVGQVVPLGKLKAQFDNSFAFGFWFRNRIIKNDFVDFGFTCFIPNKQNSHCILNQSPIPIFSLFHTKVAL